MKTICIIPARGGSKRVPRKNIKIFNGKPLITWTILNLQNTNLFDDIIISTDDPEISEVSLKHGVTVLGNRPKNLSDDLTPTMPVIQFVIGNNLDLLNPKDQIVCVYPGSVLLSKGDLENAQNLFIKLNFERFVVGATRFGHPIQRAFGIDKDNQVTNFSLDAFNQRTQDLVEFYHDSGQFYWGNKHLWLTNQGVLSNSAAITIPSWRIQDIDNLEDWERAELIHKLIMGKQI
jgi:pseudaminic acid cytidylyltransferase